jgi:hypothetical protein
VADTCECGNEPSGSISPFRVAGLKVVIAELWLPASVSVPMSYWPMSTWSKDLAKCYTLRSEIRCAFRLRYGMGSGRYRRSWISLPATFISAQ